jgi:hypothetical protein
LKQAGVVTPVVFAFVTDPLTARQRSAAKGWTFFSTRFQARGTSL